MKRCFSPGKIYFTKIQIILFLTWVVAFLNLHTGCGKPENSDYPETKIASEICIKKVVLLADNSHMNPFGYENVIQILRECYFPLASEKNKKTINLILERDDSLASAVNIFIHTGNMSKLIDDYLFDISYEDLEFFTKLKNLNDSLYKTGNISLNILGFEVSRTNTSKEFLKMSRREKELWFVNARDSLVSLKMIDYIKKHRDECFLIYYGNLHVQKGLVNKTVGNFSLSADSSFGYCVAEYLVREFGDINVPVFSGKLCEKIPFHVFSFVNSKRVLEYAKKHLESLKGYSRGESGWVSSQNMLKRISLIAGKDIKNIFELEGLIKNENTFNLNHFENGLYGDYLYTVYSRDVFNDDMRNEFSMMGFGDDFYRFTSVKRSDWDKKIWPDALRNIKILNAIGVYWVGYENEKVTAKDFLVDVSNKNFTEPSKYFEWWRNNSGNKSADSE